MRRIVVHGGVYWGPPHGLQVRQQGCRALCCRFLEDMRSVEDQACMVFPSGRTRQA